MAEVTPHKFLESRGWTFHKPSQWWYHVGKGLGDLSLHAALKVEGMATNHRWNPDTGFCLDCGMHHGRMRAEGLLNQCEGELTPQAFEDAARYDWFKNRIDAMMEAGGEGWIFIMGEQLPGDWEEEDDEPS